MFAPIQAQALESFYFHNLTLLGRECLKNECWYLRKNEEHEYWRQREITKQKRVERKERLEGMIERGA